MEALNGGLFANDLLKGSIVELDEWQALDDAALDSVERSLHEIVDRFPITQRPNESQTEDDLIWPVLARLGWTSNLRQQNLTPRGVDDVPDGLLFADEDAKDRANGFAEEWKRYEFGLAIVESKRWALFARADRFRTRQSQHRDRARLPVAPRCRFDDRDLSSVTGPRGPLGRTGSQGVAAEVRDDVPHDERFALVPHPRRSRRARRRMALGRQQVRQSRRRMAPALRGQDGAGVRSPRGKYRRQSGESAPPGAAGTRDRRTTSQRRLVTCSTVLGTGSRMRLAGGDLGSRFQEITAPTNARTFISAILPAVGFGNGCTSGK